MLSCGVMTCMFLSGCFNAPTTLNYKHADRYTMGGATITDSVRNIDINWIGGNVDVLTHNENTVSFSEISDNALMRIQRYIIIWKEIRFIFSSEKQERNCLIKIFLKILRCMSLKERFLKI